jgi:hypothetical protein
LEDICAGRVLRLVKVGLLTKLGKAPIRSVASHNFCSGKSTIWPLFPTIAPTHVAVWADFGEVTGSIIDRELLWLRGPNCGLSSHGGTIPFYFRFYLATLAG